jgi:large subunit ribosomal protein L6
MSRIGKKEIVIPENTTISIEKDILFIKGKYGTLSEFILSGINIKINDQKILIKRIDDQKKSRAFHGLMRTLVQNMVIGVNEKFTKTLLVEGVGYKFQLANNFINLNMGYSHIISFNIPEDINIKLDSPTKIIISSINKQKVGLFASKIRDVRPPEPYKGKGIKYEGEIIKRKVGKTGK